MYIFTAYSHILSKEVLKSVHCKKKKKSVYCKFHVAKGSVCSLCPISPVSGTVPGAGLVFSKCMLNSLTDH